MKNKIILLAFIFPAVALAGQLTVVEDRGGVSATGYYESLNPDPDESMVKNLSPMPIKVDETTMLPVMSKRLSPGVVAAQTLNAAGLMQPLFLVGADQMSLSWLKQRQDVLAKINAVGLAVQVRDARALSAIRSAAPKLTIMPVSGDDIAQKLRISHYPVLITSTSIEQ